MLRLMGVHKLSGDTYSVVLDRDGKRLQYEFGWSPSSHEVLPGHLDYPAQIQWDLMDYDIPDVPGQANGAFCIPPLAEVCRVVYRVAHGKEIAFPIVLDER